MGLALLLVLSASFPLGVTEEGPDGDDDGADGHGNSTGNRSGSSGRGHSDGARPSDDDNDNDEDEQGDRRHDGESGPRRPGRIEETDGSFHGRYVDFAIDLANCTITDYRLYNITFFDSIVLEGDCESDARSGPDHGHEVRLRSDEGEVRLHDAPNGLIRFAAKGGPVVFDWADGLVANDTSHGLELATGSNLTGQLRVDLDDAPNITKGSGTITATNASGSFWAHPLRGGSPERVEIRDAIKKGKVAGEIDVLLSGSEVSAEVLQYEDVIIKVSKKGDSAFRVVVDANLTEGRVFVMNVGPGLFEQGKIGVRYYDQDADGVLQEVAINESDSLDDALSIDEGEGPEYWVVLDQTGKHVLVGVPTFSVHAFEVMGVGLTVLPSIVVGTLLGVGLVAAAAVGIMPRRRLS